LWVLSVRFAVEWALPGSVLFLRVSGRAGPLELRLAADGGTVEIEAGGKVERSAPPSPSAPREVEVSFADLLLEARADGRLLASRELEPFPRQGRPPFGVSFGVERGGAAFRDVRLDRDVFYTGSWTFRVPPGQYFFLGDNSEHSEDSRKWRGREVREKGEGGRVFRTKAYAAADGRTGRVEFEDCDGVFRSLPADGVEIVDVPMSFVPAADLHGRAFAVFWPPRWFTKVPGGRVRVLP
jgi:hypothetical protein